MFNFFSKSAPIGGKYTVSGQDFNHLKNVLRMKIGEELLVSFNGKCDLCAVDSFDDDCAYVYIVKEDYKDFELPVFISLFQGLPKSDKMELIIQKAVELGASEIVPVETARSIVKLDKKKAENKTQRWQAISESGAKQSKRSIIPNVCTPIDFNGALAKIKDLDLIIVPYENHDGMKATEDALSSIKRGDKIGVFIGPEGGFDKAEISALEKSGAKTVSLGSRILRTETASITAIAMIMLYTEAKL